MLTYSTQFNDIIPKEGLLQEVIIQSSSEEQAGYRYQKDSVLPHHPFQTVIVTVHQMLVFI